MQGEGWTVLVEGASDREAIEALARRYGSDLARANVTVVSIGGAHAIGRYLVEVDLDGGLAGLCDAGEEAAFRGALERAGRGPVRSRADLERRGFFVCEADLEDELIRSLGAPGVEAVLERTGKLSSFRTFQKQPQWHGKPTEAQLRRFFGSSAGKIRYAPLLVEALDLERVPRPLAALLAHIGVAAVP